MLIYYIYAKFIYMEILAARNAKGTKSQKRRH
jgi:hypothetical protein